MESRFEVPPGLGFHPVLRYEEAGTRFLELDLLRLGAGQGWEGTTADEEAVLVIISGRCSVSIVGQENLDWSGVGSRSDPFSGSPAAIYVPRQACLQVTAGTKTEMALVRAPCEVDLPPRLIAPDEVEVVSVGTANWRRDVRLVVPPGSPISQRLIVGETLNPPGNWSGVPPHKHDCITKDENLLEEFYYYKVKPPDSFALQMIYGQDDRVYSISDDDVVVFHGGYHPTVAAPGTTVFYLWALAGERKEYKVSLDPRFDWVSQAEAVMMESRIQQMK